LRQKNSGNSKCVVAGCLSGGVHPRTLCPLCLCGKKLLLLLGGNLGLNVHIPKFTRFEDLATVKAFHEFRVFIAGDHLDTRMATWLVHGFAL
jgi:hypothetical protein